VRACARDRVKIITTRSSFRAFSTRRLYVIDAVSSRRPDRQFYTLGEIRKIDSFFVLPIVSIRPNVSSFALTARVRRRPFENSVFLPNKITRIVFKLYYDGRVDVFGEIRTEFVFSSSTLNIIGKLRIMYISSLVRRRGKRNTGASF